jgi:hypothetical protein
MKKVNWFKAVIKSVLVVTLILLNLSCFKTIEAKSEPTREEIVYLTFDFNLLKKNEAEKRIVDLKRCLGEQLKGTNRLYGFGMSTPQLLTQSTEEMSDLINIGFDLALKYDIPVFFHCDYMYDTSKTNGSGATPKYYEDPLMCEWTAFPEEGQTHGPVPRNWYNWGTWQARPAIPCFESPRFKAFIKKQLLYGVVKPVLKRLDELKAKKKEYLFAGISAGWETHVPNFTPPSIYNLNPDNPPVYIEDSNVVMQKWEMAQTGYAALYWRGWNQKKIEKEALKRGIEQNQLITDILYDVTHDYMEMCARVAFEAGIPRNKIFTHIVPMESTKPRNTSSVPKIWTAVNDYSVPGFTFSQGSGAVYDMNALREKIALVAPAQKHIACCEGYTRFLDSYADFGGFLNEMTNGGAILINLIGWTDPHGSPFKIIPESPAINAAKDWLAGKELKEINP